MDYTALSVADVRTQLDDIARETLATFGGFDRRQLNWRPDETQWSVAQCFEHLLSANSLMFRAADEALNDGRSRSFWERLPILPGVVGRMMIRSLAPNTKRNIFFGPPPVSPDAAALTALGSYIVFAAIAEWLARQRTSVAT